MRLLYLWHVNELIHWCECVPNSSHQVVAGQCNAVKVSLYNSGQRSAFVQVLCYPGLGTSKLRCCQSVSES